MNGHGRFDGWNKFSAVKWVPLFGLVTLGCSSAQTGLEVIVEADLEVANRSSRVSFEVRTQEGQVALSEQFDLVQTPFPIRRLVAPRGGDVSRVVTITAQALNSEGEALTTARIIR